MNKQNFDESLVRIRRGCLRTTGEKMKKTIYLVLIIALCAVFPAQAQVAGNPPYTLEQSVIASGGGAASDLKGGAYSINGTIGQFAAGTKSSNNPFTVTGGFWTPSPLAPTAANVSIAGRAVRADGAGIRNVIVTLVETDGSIRTALTGGFGYYQFTDITAGQTVIISASAKRFNFSQPTQILSLMDDANGIDFIALEP